MSTKSEKVKLLTLSPSTFSILKTSKYFDVPVTMVRKDNLAELDKMLGQSFSPELKNSIQVFYESNKYFRIYLRKKQFVSVKIDMKEQNAKETLN